KLLDGYSSVQEKITKNAEDIIALPAGPAGTLQRSALTGQGLALLRDQLDPRYDQVRDAITRIVGVADDTALQAAERITTAVATAKTGILACIIVGLALALLFGFFVLRSVTRPLGWLVGVMDRIREGDFTQRVERTDEFRALGESFNRMAT